MSRISAVLLLAGLAFAAMLTSWPAGGSSSASCTDVSPTPTGDPTPSPLPPFTPYEVVSICNDTGQAVSDLHILLAHSAVNENPIIGNIPGCPEPAYFYGGSPPYATVDIDWGTPCVPHGGDVTLSFDAGCTTPEPGCGAPRVQCFYWTLDGAPVPSASPAVNPPTCANPSPIPTATPQPTGPCPARGTPAVTPPAVTPVPDIPSPGSTWRDYGISVIITLCNDTVASASDLHVDFSFPYSFFWLMANPPGCPEPSFTPDPHSLDEYRFEVDWGEDCVNPGEFLSMGFHYWCGHICGGPQPYCYTWTRFGQPVYQGQGDCLPPTPTPTATPTPTPTPAPTPVTATPSDCPAPVLTPWPAPTPMWATSFLTFCNDTGQAMSDLHVSMGYVATSTQPLSANAPGCPSPEVWGVPPLGGVGTHYDIVWPSACVGRGEMVTLEFTQDCTPSTCSPPSLRCYYWTLNGLPVAPEECIPPPVNRLWGDIDCTTDTGSVDALKTLRYVAGMSLTQREPCPRPGNDAEAGGMPVKWGDVNCDGNTDAGDAMALLRHEAGMLVEQTEPCVDVGELVAVLS